MSWDKATDPPPRYQWERWDSEPPNGSVNCNPSSTAFLLDYYRGGTHSINALRRSIGLGTGKTMSSSQVEVILKANGVPAYTAQLSLAALKSLISGGRHPVLVGLWMVRVPLQFRGYSFTGMHGVVALANAWRNGVSGILFMDPNFNPPGRPDSQHGQRFIPDAVVESAMHSDQNPAIRSRSVVPVSAKNAPPPPAPVPPVTAPGFPRQLQFAKGTYTGVQFSSAGDPVKRKTYTLPKTSSAPASLRSHIKKQTGFWYYITAGIWAGYWIRETPGIT